MSFLYYDKIVLLLFLIWISILNLRLSFNCYERPTISVCKNKADWIRKEKENAKSVATILLRAASQTGKFGHNFDGIERDRINGELNQSIRTPTPGELGCVPRDDVAYIYCHRFLEPLIVCWAEIKKYFIGWVSWIVSRLIWTNLIQDLDQLLQLLVSKKVFFLRLFYSTTFFIYEFSSENFCLSQNTRGFLGKTLSDDKIFSRFWKERFFSLGRRKKKQKKPYFI